MTREEATEYIYDMICDIHDNSNYSITDKENAALNMAIEALQKQISKQPTIENGFVKCPACELYIRFPIADRYNNCPECGQALKWEGEDD